jgi:hypothetical protein
MGNHSRFAAIEIAKVDARVVTNPTPSRSQRTANGIVVSFRVKSWNL